MTWFRRRKLAPHIEAEKAKERAQADLDRVRAIGPEVSRVAASLARSRKTNGFADQIRLIFEGGE